MRRFASDDEGMTIVEVVVAAAILFFIMTAILGLVSRTTLMSAQATRMNDVNNTVNSYVEWMRSLPFDQIATPSLETTTIATGDYTIQIVPSVEASQTYTYIKNVWLNVSATRAADGVVQTLTTMVMIHDRDQYISGAVQGGPTDPKIMFTSICPPDGTAVYSNPYAKGTPPTFGGTYWKDASGTVRPLYLSVNVKAIEPRTVEEVYIQGEQSWDLEAYGSSDKARWALPTWTDSPTFWWDLGQKSVLDELLVQEGIRSIYGYVRDSGGVIRYDMRQFCVDNEEPAGTMDPISWETTGSAYGTLSWPVVMDGTSPSFSYSLELRKQPLTSATGYSGWTYANYYVKYENKHVYTAAAPMSRYAVRGQAISPRGLKGGISDMYHFVTRPKLTGTYVVERVDSSSKWWKVTSTLKTAAPSFESTGTTYAWYEDGTLLGTTPTNQFSVPPVIALGDPDIVPFPARKYQVVVYTTPLGLGGGTPVAVASNIVTPTTYKAGLYYFLEGTW